MMRFMAIVSTLLFCLLTSCGDLGVFFEKHKKKKNIELARIHLRKPIYFQRDDKSCDAAHAVDDIRDSSGHIKVWIGVNNKVSLESVHLPYPISGKGLQTDFIEDTLWGFKKTEEHTCSLKFDTIYCEDNTTTQIKNQGERLHFCKTGGDYPRESLENIALASLVGIAETYKIHESLYPNPSFKKINLLVHAEITSHYLIGNHKTGIPIDQIKVKTDNAFWSHKGDSFTIASIPPSEEVWQNRNSESPHVWEIPGVMSHEYGHHAFHHYAPSLGSLTRQGIRESSEIESIVSALNEACADLFAYFTYSHSPEFKKWGWPSLNGVYFTREVSKDFYSDGSKKEMKEWYLHHYIHETQNLPFNVHSPNTQDDHDLGALLAHGLYRLFTLEEKSPNQTQLQSAYTQLVLWNKKLEADFSTYTDRSPEKFLEYTLVEALKIAKATHKTRGFAEIDVNTKLQTAFNTVFPVFEKPLTEIESL